MAHSLTTPQRDGPWTLRVVLAGWIALSFVTASQMYVAAGQVAEAPSFPLVLGCMLAIWSYWVPGTWLVLALDRRAPLRRGAWRAATGHLMASIALGVAHIALIAGTLGRFEALQQGEAFHFQPMFAATMAGYFHTELVLYWAILGAALARDHHRRARERERHAVELEAQLGAARLQLLESQIRPHFLFNALNTVAMMVRSGESEQAVQMIGALGKLFRSSLEGGAQQEVPLSRELELVERYLDVERRRFPDRLRVELDVAPALLEARVPSLILQPLVENSVRHGVARSPRAGRVCIAGRTDGSWLELSVRDDGPGLGQAADSGAQRAPGNAGSGVGLANTRNRLAELYGARHSFQLENAPEGGAVARIRIPYRDRGVAGELP